MFSVLVWPQRQDAVIPRPQISQRPSTAQGDSHIVGFWSRFGVVTRRFTDR